MKTRDRPRKRPKGWASAFEGIPDKQRACAAVNQFDAAVLRAHSLHLGAGILANGPFEARLSDRAMRGQGRVGEACRGDVAGTGADGRDEGWS